MKSCQKCGKCCRAHPCALSPEDVRKIASHFRLTSEQLFKKYLVIDYVHRSNERLYYPCPARKGDKRGTIVSSNWALSDSPCIFLTSNRCAIEEVKPKGGRTLSCSLMTLGRNQIGYGKTKATLDWNNNLLKQMIHAIESPSKVREESECCS